MGLGSGGFSKPIFQKPKPNGPAGQLYNMEEDLAENNNLWLQKPDVVVELREMLEDAWQNS